MKKNIFIVLICTILILSPVTILAAGATEYDFSDEAQQKFEQNNVIPYSQNYSFTKQKNSHPTKDETIIRSNYDPNNSKQQILQQSPLTGSVVKIPEGTTFSVTFNSGINSGSMDKNDRLTATLTNDWYYNDTLIAPSGSLVYGTAINAKSAGLAYGSGGIEIEFNQILLPNGNMINFKSLPIKLQAKSERVKNMGRDILIGTAASLLTGVALTAIGGGDDWGRNMLVFGSIGAIGGGFRGTMQRGKDVDIPDGTDIQIILEQPLSISPYN